MPEARMPSFIRLVCHGGQCCGVKHIYKFCNPDQILPAVKARSGGVLGPCSQQHAVGKNFYKGAAPAESAEDRLDRVLKWCQTYQPGGLIEVCLTECQTSLWHKILLKHGFTLGPNFRNSNTGSRIQVYYLVNIYKPMW